MSVITKIKQTLLDKEMLVSPFYFIGEKIESHLYYILLPLYYELFIDIFIRLH